MKNKLILLALLCGCTLFIDAQNDTLKTHRHELGADITGLLKQFFNFNANANGSVTLPNYYISYRYHLKKIKHPFWFWSCLFQKEARAYT